MKTIFFFLSGKDANVQGVYYRWPCKKKP